MPKPADVIVRHDTPHPGRAAKLILDRRPRGQGRRRVRDAVTLALAPVVHPVRDRRQALAVVRAPRVRDLPVRGAVEFDDGHVRAARAAGERHGERVAVGGGVVLVKRGRVEAEGGEGGGADGVAGEEAGEAAAVGHAGGVGAGGVDAVLGGE